MLEFLENITDYTSKATLDIPGKQPLSFATFMKSIHQRMPCISDKACNASIAPTSMHKL